MRPLHVAPLRPEKTGAKPARVLEKPTPDDGLSETAKAMQGAQPYVGAVWKMVGGAVVGVGGGYGLDVWLGIAPWGLIGLSVLGISAGFYGFLHDMARLGRKPKPESPKN